MKIVESLNKLGEIIIPKKWEPIGTIKMFDREQDMSKLYYGTWELTLKERSPIGINLDSTDDRFKTAGNQFGEKEHTLTIDEMPSHGHNLQRNSNYSFVSSGYSGESGWRITDDLGISNGGIVLAASVSNTGGGQAHNNIHPVEVVYFYKRVA